MTHHSMTHKRACGPAGLARPGEGRTRVSARWVRRPTAPVLTLVACLLALPLAGGAGPQNAARDAAPVPQQVQAELQAAHQARTHLAEETRAWTAEKERLDLLLSAVRRRTERLQAEAKEAEAARDELKKKLDTLSAETQRLETVRTLFDALSERLEKDLETLAAGALPGLVPPDAAAGVTDPARRLDAAVARLEETESRLATVTVEIVTGVLEGREVTVKLLRAGGAAAWWTSLDGDRAGTARREGDRLVLQTLAAPAAAEAIRKAVAVAEGRAAPDWTLLPAGHVEVKE